VLIVLDVYSRYVQGRALERKDADTVLAAFKKIIAVMGPCKRLTSDPGSEFTNNTFAAYCKSKGIQQDITAAKDHFRLGMIDSFTRTFRAMVEKYVTATGDHKYDRVLPHIFRNFNSQIHSSIKAKPIDVWRDPSKSNEVHDTTPVRPDLKVGVTVRVAEKKGTFGKAGTPNWSKDTYKVEERVSLARWKLAGLPTPRHYSELKVVSAPQAVRKGRARQAR
jgi:hypothetical protein